MLRGPEIAEAQLRCSDNALKEQPLRRTATPVPEMSRQKGPGMTSPDRTDIATRDSRTRQSNFASLDGHGVFLSIIQL